MKSSNQTSITVFNPLLYIMKLGCLLKFLTVNAIVSAVWASFHILDLTNTVDGAASVYKHSSLPGFKLRERRTSKEVCFSNDGVAEYVEKGNLFFAEYLMENVD
jgi:hypothetical protein